jgi:hypothetical protein
MYLQPRRIPVLSAPLFTCLVTPGCGDDGGNESFGGVSVSASTPGTSPMSGTEGGTTESMVTEGPSSTPSDPSATAPDPTNDPSATVPDPTNDPSATMPTMPTMPQPSDPSGTTGYGTTSYGSTYGTGMSMSYGSSYGTMYGSTYGSGTYGTGYMTMYYESEGYMSDSMPMCYQSGDYCYYDDECCSGQCPGPNYVCQ